MSFFGLTSQSDERYGQVRFDPRWHEVIEIDFVKTLRRHFQDPLLFTYRHKKTRNWLVAAWHDRPFGAMQELLVLGKEPVGTREHIKRIELMVRGNAQAERNRKKNLHELKYVNRRAEEEEIEDYREDERLNRHISDYYKHSQRQFVVNG